MVSLPRDQRRAAAIVACALERGAVEISAGVHAEQIRHAVLRAMVELGGEPVFRRAGGSDDVLVEVNGIHVGPGFDERLTVGNVVTVDAGCRFGSWCADAARTWRVAEAGAEQFCAVLEVYELVVRTMQALGRAQSWADVRREVYDWVNTDRPGWQVELTGHGIGRELHEDPVLNGDSAALFAVNGEALAVEFTVRRRRSIDRTAAQTVEVIRFEETVWRGEGCVEILTRG